MIFYFEPSAYVPQTTPRYEEFLRIVSTKKIGDKPVDEKVVKLVTEYLANMQDRPPFYEGVQIETSHLTFRVCQEMRQMMKHHIGLGYGETASGNYSVAQLIQLMAKTALIPAAA